MYNVAPFIERCIRSLENQDILREDYEIICINDGSPDNVQEIVEKLQLEFSNIILINQENQGVSMARNNGIAIAKGKYILPIDPDDFVLSNSFGYIKRKIESADFDIAYLGFEFFNVEEHSVWKTDYNSKVDIDYSGLDGYFEARGAQIKDPDRSWAILYKNSLLEKFQIKYPKNVPYLEDGLFLAKVFSVAEKVIFFKEYFYQRTTRIGSATNSNLFYTDQSINGFMNAIDDVKEFAIKNNLKGKQLLLINHVIAKFVFLPLTSSLTSTKKIDFLKIVKLLKNKGLGTLNLNGCRGTYLIYGKAYNKSIFHYIIAFYAIKFKGKLTTK